MFDGMGPAGHLILVTKAPDVDVERSTRLVRFRIMDDKNFKLVP